MNKLVIEYTMVNDDDEEVTHECPAVYAVCHRCQGRGTHVNPAVDGHGISPDEFAEDPSFEEEYFNGTYDIQCLQCKGERVTLVPDENSKDQDALKKYKEWERNQARLAREFAHEVEMGY